MYSNTLYGLSIYSETIPSEQDVEALSPDLMKYLPPYYHLSFAIREVMKAEETQLGTLNYYIKDLEKQFSLESATWGLAAYERELGITTNISLSYEERREVIKAKWRSVGTTTKAMIKNVAEAFSGGEVDIIEYPKESYFIIKFIGIKGIPKNMKGFIDTLEKIIPAHLGYEFKYSYTVWNALSPMTWSQAGLKTWDGLKVYEEV